MSQPVQELATALRSGDRSALARAITLVESTRPDHRQKAQELLLELTPEAGSAVHVVGVSSLAAGHLTLVPALRDALAEVGRPDIMVVVGGVIPPGDFDELYAAGATAIFPPGTVISDAAVDLLHKLADRLGYTLS